MELMDRAPFIHVPYDYVLVPETRSADLGGRVAQSVPLSLVWLVHSAGCGGAWLSSLMTSSSSTQEAYPLSKCVGKFARNGSVLM